MIDQKEVGIYVHIPYCLSKCPYCDFNSVDAAPAEARYSAALVKELSFLVKSAAVRPGPVGTIYFGGGTPTLFKPDYIDMVLQAAGVEFELSGNAEITIEANPATVDLESLKALRSAGINRISLGVQSFSDEALARLGRAHS
ncbi:MAG: radical SAM protein, partial [Thermodesulfobacteriota bacterium]